MPNQAGASGEFSVTQPVISIEWIELPTMRFTMGSNRKLGQPDDDEGPIRDVSVGSLAVSANPISVANFGGFVSATRYVTTAEREGNGFVRTSGGRELRDGPTWRSPRAESAAAADSDAATQVSWPDAVEFCRWSGTRLLREAEWERCARHGVPEMAEQPFLEWVADYYDASFHRDEQRVNPTGPIGGIHRVARGGGHCTRRTAFLPDMSSDDLTFRVVRL